MSLKELFIGTCPIHKTYRIPCSICSGDVYQLGPHFSENIEYLKACISREGIENMDSGIRKWQGDFRIDEYCSRHGRHDGNCSDCLKEAKSLGRLWLSPEEEVFIRESYTNLSEEDERQIEMCRREIFGDEIVGLFESSARQPSLLNNFVVLTSQF